MYVIFSYPCIHKVFMACYITDQYPNRERFLLLYPDFLLALSLILIILYSFILSLSLSLSIYLPTWLSLSTSLFLSLSLFLVFFLYLLQDTVYALLSIHIKFLNFSPSLHIFIVWLIPLSISLSIHFSLSLSFSLFSSFSFSLSLSLFSLSWFPRAGGGCASIVSL